MAGEKLAFTTKEAVGRDIPGWSLILEASRERLSHFRTSQLFILHLCRLHRAAETILRPGTKPAAAHPRIPGKLEFLPAPM